ncbi:MAG TPA: tyrosine--tRNA ligase [Clostridiales bacterium]|nr:tyrosine--tRNA ligase [Clostridiales bacterium]HBE12917.1 tyrosine--tRNA ligase [Clostridiales bacterium]
MGIFQELKDRGMLAQTTNETELERLFETEKVVFYIGFDPTADSLHVGHFLQMMVMARLQKAGHFPIALMGGGTGMIGDPSGRTDMRKMLTRKNIDHNVSCFKKQMQRLLDFSEGKAMIVNNADWLLDLNYVEFLREVGVHFSVNRMLSAECFKSRYERGLTFFEFNYMLMQGYDFYRLCEDYNCRVELGGDDQWSNILAGVELIRRKTGKAAYGMTFKLLTTSDGRKMGKTQSGAVWLDARKTSPYDFFQYWRNIDDADVINCMKMLTFLTLDEIAVYEKAEGVKINSAKERLAYELTLLVHGKEEANSALSAAKAVFSGQGKGMPETKVDASALIDGEMTTADLIVLCGLEKSKGDAKRTILQGGLTINDEKVTQFDTKITLAMLESGVVMKKGKKTFHKAVLK